MGESWKSVGQLNPLGLSLERDDCGLEIFQPVGPERWNLILQNSWRDTEDYIKNVDPDLIAVTLPRNPYAHDKRSTPPIMHENRRACVLNTAKSRGGS